MHSRRPLGESLHRETRQNFLILRNEQIQNVYKQSQKIQNIYNFSDILQKGDVNQMKPTWAMYFLQSALGHSLGFHDLILFLNLFNELQFFILFGTMSQIFGPKYLTDWIP